MAETATLKVGDAAPDFELTRDAMTREKFKLSDHKGKNAVVINFVPAAFSPACSNQLPLIEQKRKDFEAQGAIPVAISTDHAWALKAWKEQLGLGYDVLADDVPQGNVARQYGVFIEPAGVANRVVVVVGKDGKVAWIQPVEKITDMPDYDPVLACSKD
ncbi:MAG: redoxin domain-containing protein [Dehalococcoidia bacterium]